MLKHEMNAATVALLPEAKGFLLLPVAEENDLDVAFIRKRNYRTRTQIVIRQEKAYKDKEESDLMYCVGLRRGDIPLIMDDIISSGGTIISIARALRSLNYKIAGIGTLYERGVGIEKVKEETGYEVKSLARLKVTDNRISVLSFHR